MRKPRRGEIWRVRFGLGKVGTEQDATKPQEERPCLVVSADDFSSLDDSIKGYRFTVIPLTNYTDGKEDTRALWAVTITNRDDVITRSDDEQLPEWLTDSRGRPVRSRIGSRTPYIPRKSIIDCAQPWNIFALSQSDIRNVLCWDRHHGILKDELMVRVEAALQVLIDDCIHYRLGYLRFMKGDVIRVALPGGDPQDYLVISSMAVDAIRKHVFAHGRDPLRQCTVVPLILPPDDYEEDDLGTCLVEVYPVGRKATYDIKVAMCQEIYTIDWWARDAEGPVGQVH